MSISPTPWNSPTLLAPLHGVGAPIVRDHLAALGSPGLICAPFIRITAHAPNPLWLQSLVHRTAGVPLSVQLLGNHAENLGLATRCLCELGLDVIDLNLGCPSRLVNRKGVGAALLASESEIARIVTTMRQNCQARLSVKIRSGDDSPQRVTHIAKVIEEAGADFLVVHPRLRTDGYAGVADWNIVKCVKAILGIPVVGNGDCWYAEDALYLMEKSGVDAIMLGRPALRNPFIFRQIEQLRRGEVAFVPTGLDIARHVEQLGELFTPLLGHTRRGPWGALKEHLQYLLRAVPEPQRSALWHRAKRASSVPEVLEAIRPLREIEQLDLAPNGPFRFETTPLDSLQPI